MASTEAVWFAIFSIRSSRYFVGACLCDRIVLYVSATDSSFTSRSLISVCSEVEKFVLDYMNISVSWCLLASKFCPIAMSSCTKHENICFTI